MSRDLPDSHFPGDRSRDRQKHAAPSLQVRTALTDEIQQIVPIEPDYRDSNRCRGGYCSNANSSEQFRLCCTVGLGYDTRIDFWAWEPSMPPLQEVHA